MAVRAHVDVILCNVLLQSCKELIENSILEILTYHVMSTTKHKISSPSVPENLLRRRERTRENTEPRNTHQPENHGKRKQRTNQEHINTLWTYPVVDRMIYRVIHKSVKHFKNSQQINNSTDHGISYADRERNSPSFFLYIFHRCSMYPPLVIRQTSMR